jgi:SRSO17 transposase
MAAAATTATLTDPARWGLAAGTVAEGAERVRAVWGRYRTCFRTQTRDPSETAWLSLRGLLTVDQERPFANSARRVHGPEADGQQVQHFMSASPWSAQAVQEQVRAEVAATPALHQGSVLILDERADGKAGAQSAGAGRHYNGRLGKVALRQVGTFLALAHEAARFWTWSDGELFLPAHGFAPERAELRQRLGIPADRRFAPTIALGGPLIPRVQASGVPFAAVLGAER